MKKDYDLFKKINKFANRYNWLDQLGVFFAEYSGFVMILVMIFLLWKDQLKQDVFFRAVALAFFARFVLLKVIRKFIVRSRPFTDHKVNLLIKRLKDLSFPSGHSTFFFTLSFVVWYYNQDVGSWMLLNSFLIGISRIFVGVHYPLDILGGSFLGYLVAFLNNKFF
jgi:undecaprenyl-diphosphatase